MPFRCTADAPHRKADRCPACALAARVAIRFHCADSADTPSKNRTVPSPYPSSKNLSTVLCAVSAYGPPQNQIVPGLCPRQRAAQYSFAVPLFLGCLACFLSARHRNPSTICNIRHILYRITVQPGWALVDMGMKKADPQFCRTGFSGILFEGTQRL